MEHENSYERFGSKGMTGTALGLAIGALGVEALGGGFDNILGKSGSKKDEGYSRYDAAKDARIAALETEVKLRDANTFTLGEINALRNYVDGKINCIEAQISAQSVVNAQVTANLSCMQANIATLMGLTKTVVPIDSICPTPAVATTTAGA